MGSDNPTGADNQQETKRLMVLEARWITGFVDGEGCFSVSVHRNPGAPHGWQLMPVFQVYQHRDHRAVLEALVGAFGCGWIRPKGPASEVLTFGVQARPDLLTKVIPFFELYPLLVKGDDFELFATIVRSLEAKEHLERSGFERLVELAYRMNRHGKQRRREMASIVGSSETVRQAPVNSREMRQSDPHGDMWSQAEMT